MNATILYERGCLLHSSGTTPLTFITPDFVVSAPRSSRPVCTGPTGTERAKHFGDAARRRSAT